MKSFITRCVCGVPSDDGTCLHLQTVDKELFDSAIKQRNDWFDWGVALGELLGLYNPSYSPPDILRARLSGRIKSLLDFEEQEIQRSHRRYIKREGPVLHCTKCRRVV